FVRTNTYAPRLGLLQVAINEQTACIDPLADMNLSRLWEILFDPERTSILHSGKQDMEVFWFTCGKVTPKLIDTQVCAALLGHPAQIGYAGLAAELVNAEIAKTQTRTDWSRRPLTEAQLHYAAEDVEHLANMHELLKSSLVKLGRYQWALEDSLAITDISLYRPDPDSAWQRLKSIPFLPPAEQARARALAAWREQRAVDADKPRSWILSDKALLQIAQQNPNRTDALRNIDDLPAAVIRKQGDRLLDLIENTNQAVAEGDLKLTQEFPNPEQDKARVKKLSAIIRAEAEGLNVAAEVLGSKRDIQALIRAVNEGKDCRLTTGWRKHVVGDKLLEAL
ncbi:MAG: ribonuclease D, partial [Gammaproteobacteria bacterium]